MQYNQDTDKLSRIKAKCATYREAQREFQYCVTKDATTRGAELKAALESLVWEIEA